MKNTYNKEYLFLT